MFRFLFLFLFSFSCFSQSVKAPKNTLKLNLTGLGVSMLSLQHEYKLKKNFSIVNTVFYRSKVLIPFGNTVDKIAKKQGVGLTDIKFGYIFLDQAKVAYNGYSPEARWYVGKNKKIILGAFGQIENFNSKVPAALPVRLRGQIAEVTTPINFRFQTLSGGVLIGRKFQWKQISADLIIIGPHPGIAKKFNVNLESEYFASLSEDDRGFLKEKLKERFGITEKYFNTVINEKGAYINSIKPVPYLGLKGLIVNLGYSF